MTAERDTYNFAGSWVIERPVDELREQLLDLLGYPRWWPQVRAVARLGEDDAIALVRSALPYTLTVRLTAESRGPRVLQCALAGDMVGFVRWTLDAAVPPSGGPATVLSYEQQVRVGRPLLQLGGRVARPLLVANHEHMMRSAISRLKYTVTTSEVQSNHV